MNRHIVKKTLTLKSPLSFIVNDVTLYSFSNVQSAFCIDTWLTIKTIAKAQYHSSEPQMHNDHT